MSKIPKYSENPFKYRDEYKEIMKIKRQPQKNQVKAKMRGNTVLEEKWKDCETTVREDNRTEEVCYPLSNHDTTL